MDRADFSRARATALAAIRKDAALSATARLIAIHIAEEHLNPRNRGAWPSNETVGDAIGKCARTVSRAKTELQNAGHIIIEGRGRNQSNRVLFSAIEMVGQGVDETTEKHGQKCPSRRTVSSLCNGQKCPPNLRKEPYKKPYTRSGRSFPRNPVKAHSNAAVQWKNALKEQSLLSLASYDIEAIENGEAVYILPAPRPPESTDADEWQRIKIYLEERLK